MPALQLEFGASVIAADGGLDRARMRELVFADPAAKRRLEAILHPLIGAECERQAATAEAGQTIVFDVPLVVDASEATQLERVVARSGWTPDAVRSVIAQQAERGLRRAAADALIFNEKLTLAELSLEVRSLWERWADADTR